MLNYMSTPLFSIIIPVYNGQDVIGRALDSIYSQGLSDEQFEVICVDDCSPTLDTFNAINNYLYQGVHPANLKVMRHEVNKRQGGARNTGVASAHGEWMLYLDQDDFFVRGGLEIVSKELQKYAFCDIVMFDYELRTILPDRQAIANNIYAKQNMPDIVISGTDFMKKYSMPWTPWCYAYKRTFLMGNLIQFVENVRFEDVDYVMRCTLLANKMVFLPINTYCHIDSGTNTSFVRNDRNLIEDLCKISIRMKNVAYDFIPVDKDAAMAAMNHHIFHFHDLLVRYLWRLPYRYIVELLEKYLPYEESGDALINFATNHSYAYALTATVVKPFLLCMSWMKNKVRR